MANILKPIGFVLILGAVAAGAYYFGQSGAGKKSMGQAKELVSNAMVPGNATSPSAGGGVVDPDVTAVAGVPDPATAPAQAPKTHPAISKPAPKPATPPSTASTTVMDAVPTTVTALAGDLVLTRAKAKVRLLGVNTPDQGQDSIHAREELAKILGDGAVKIQLTADRTAALVWRGDLLVNESMIRRGWSRAGEARFTTAEAAAKAQGAGLWSPEGWMGVNP